VQSWAMVEATLYSSGGYQLFQVYS